MTDPFFPKVVRGKVPLPNIGDYVYVPTVTAPHHFIGGRAKVTQVVKGTSIGRTQVSVEEQPGIVYTWMVLGPSQYELWEKFREKPARPPTEEEATQEAARKEAIRVYHESRAKVPIAPSRSKGHGNKPSHVLRVKDPQGDGYWATVGAVWASPEGSFYVKLNPGTVLSWKDGLTIRIFPKEDEE